MIVERHTSHNGCGRYACFADWRIKTRFGYPTGLPGRSRPAETIRLVFLGGAVLRAALCIVGGVLAGGVLIGAGGVVLLAGGVVLVGGVVVLVGGGVVVLVGGGVVVLVGGGVVVLIGCGVVLVGILGLGLAGGVLVVGVRVLLGTGTTRQSGNRHHQRKR